MKKKRVILVSGMSGAGKTSATSVLEDMGYHLSLIHIFSKAMDCCFLSSALFMAASFFYLLYSITNK